jgi:hypothetical protein
MDVTETRVFQSQKTDLANARFVTRSLEAPGAGQVLVRIEHFALTANNITYGVAGDSIGYWNFFPVVFRSGVSG